MTIEKLPSGSYRITQMYKGKRYRVTVSYKPTQKEALLLLADKIKDTPATAESVRNNSFSEYCDLFIAYTENKGKSPSTVRGYVSLISCMSDKFKALRLSDITEEDIQDEINRYAENHAPKSVSNLHGLIHSILSKYRPKFRYSIELPSKVKKAEYEPSTKDVQRIIEASAGSKYHVAILLGVLALRRGEIAAITAADIDDNNVLTIDKDLVVDKNGNQVIKHMPKTADSYRRILIPQSLADEIRAQGQAYKGNMHSINEYLHKLQDKLGIPRFRYHMLRHFAVAYLHREGFTDQQIMSYGGWSNSSDIMKRAYRYNLDPEQAQQSIVSSFSSFVGNPHG